MTQDPLSRHHYIIIIIIIIIIIGVQVTIIVNQSSVIALAYKSPRHSAENRATPISTTWPRRQFWQ